MNYLKTSLHMLTALTLGLLMVSSAVAQSGSRNAAPAAPRNFSPVRTAPVQAAPRSFQSAPTVSQSFSRPAAPSQYGMPTNYGMANSTARVYQPSQSFASPAPMNYSSGCSSHIGGGYSTQTDYAPVYQQPIYSQPVTNYRTYAAPTATYSMPTRSYYSPAPVQNLAPVRSAPVSGCANGSCPLN